MNRFSALLILSSLLLLAPVTAQKKDGDVPDKALREAELRKSRLFSRLDNLKDNKSLRWTADVFFGLAHLDDPTVVNRLLDAYRKPPCGDEETRNLVAAALANRYHMAPRSGFGEPMRPRKASKDEVKALLRFLQQECKNRLNIWAAYNVAFALALQEDATITQELKSLLRNDKQPAPLRAAILEAFMACGHEQMADDLMLISLEPLKKDVNGAMLVESWAWAASRVIKKHFVKDKPLEGDAATLALILIMTLENPKFAHPRTMRELCLALQAGFGTKYPYAEPVLWQGILDSGKDPLRDDGNTVTTFLGLDAFGDRIVFVIDASDSMLNPLSDAEKDKVKGPVTGDNKKKRKSGEPYDIDWSRVRNRFDAAREHVKYTLSRLKEEKQVCILLFGDECRPLPATPGFVKSTPGVLKRIFSSLDQVPIGRPEPEGNPPRPNGSLMGETNLYGALLGAYRMGKAGPINAPREHIDEKLMAEGADTIFVLSDGRPIRDGLGGKAPDFDEERRYASYHDSEQDGEGYWIDIPEQPAIPPQPEYEYETVDPETGARKKVKVPGHDGFPAQPASRKWVKLEKRTERMSAQYRNGPFVRSPELTDRKHLLSAMDELEQFTIELRRLNLFRKCLVHCVGIGEADTTWLKPIAAVGRGQVQYLGTKPQLDDDDWRRRMPQPDPDDMDDPQD